ncbi:hypothetical protein QEH56_12020 [Pelagicoccus enzymogenes]|uniref:hypothetical protein n=1 Tax=Pelagicoccus enzymogenes TaxID=2773457 RepID=UPI00280F2E48|nr:hypothetical protein [Pelagicoccus enzymogenes]MDQ8198883.1 hypothetical protein [Pelagicoccus enzymogenes]
MPVKYRYNPKARILEVECSGVLVIDEIMRYFEDIRNDPSVAKEAIELVDLSRVRHFNVDFKDASSMPAGYVSAHVAKEIRATILFGANSLNEGLAELIKAHFLHSMPDHFFMVVKTWDEAQSLAAHVHTQRDSA